MTKTKAPIIVHLTADIEPMKAAMDEILSLLPPDLAEDAASYLIDNAAELFVLEQDCSAAPSASELLIRISPSDAHARLVAALRAGDFDLSSIKNAFGHIASPSGGQG